MSSMVKASWKIWALSLLLLLTGGGTAMSADQTSFDWKASDSAPEHYPMQIISGTLRYHGDSNGAGLYVPGGGVISHGWGRMNSAHITGPDLKPLPDKLDITFFSYLEDQFYRGSFDLPYDTILSLFQEEEAKPKRKTMDGKELPNDYRIIVGVAPGGTVAVWMRSQGTKELFFGKAQKVEMDFTKAMDFPAAKRTEYVRKILESEVTSEFLTSIRKNGIPFTKWADFRKTYNWTPMFAVSNPPKKIGISLFSGEGDDYTFPLDKTFTAIGHRVPSRIDFSYAINGQGAGYYYIIRFDEAEILGAFNRLSAKHLPMQLEVDPKYPKEQTQVRLHNGKEAIPLKKFTVKSK